MNGIRVYAMVMAASLVVCLDSNALLPGAIAAAAEEADAVGVPSYAFTTLAVSGASSTDAWDINNHGVIAGHYVSGNVTHGFVANRRGAFRTIDAPDAVFTQATAINDRGDIAGTYRLANDPVMHA